MNENKMNPNAKLSFLERFAYGIGDYAGNLVYSAISAFLLVYYTNVVGASAAAAASIIAISKIFDGISDLVMGYIIDHTHSKWGKARPWIRQIMRSVSGMYGSDVYRSGIICWQDAVSVYVPDIQLSFYDLLYRN